MKFCVIVGKIIFFILEAICAIVSACIFVATVACYSSLASVGIAYVGILLIITSILGVLNALMTLYFFLTRVGED